MLLHLKGHAEKINDTQYKLVLNIPELYLNDATYTITLRSIMLELGMLDEYTSHQFWTLSTTAVDKSAINPQQEIASFHTPVHLESGYTSIVSYEPSIKRDYIIQIPSIHTSDFMLTSLRQDARLEIVFLNLLLEINRYARV